MDRRGVLIAFVVGCCGLALGTYLWVTRTAERVDAGETADGTPERTPGAPALRTPGAAERDRSPGQRRDRDPRNHGVSRPDGAGPIPTDDGGLRVPPRTPPRPGDELDAGTSANPYPASPDGIRAAVRGSVPEIEECYDGWLALNPDLEGSMIITFGIAAGEDELGHVEQVALAESALEHEFMEGCVLNVLEGLAFEPPGDGTMMVTYPLHFASDEDEPGDGELPRESL